jgi:hypothetical protein
LKKIKLEAPVRDIYVSCSVTGLAEDQQKEIINIGKRIRFLCEQLKYSSFFPYDYINEEVDENGVRFSDEEIRERLKRVTKSVKLFIMIVSSKSYGVGTECEMVDSASIPMILIKVNGSKITEMVTGSNMLRCSLDFNASKFNEQFKKEVSENILHENWLQKLWRAMRASYQEFCYIMRVN